MISSQWAELLRAPLELAVAKGNRGLAQKLARAGADIGDALHAAARGGLEGIVNDLLENGASVTAKDAVGDTPLHTAAQGYESQMVPLLLLKGGADKDALNNKEHTPLHLAALWGHVDAARTLLTAGADVSLRCGEEGRSVVHMAAGRGHFNIVRVAIEHGADVDAVDIRQKTALHNAACSGEVEAIDVLLQAGANMEARDDEGCAPLHDATYQLSLGVVLALLKHGADVIAETMAQETPLHYAVLKAGTLGAAEMVDNLLRSGADETILNNEGKAAADIVAEDVDEEDQIAENVERVCELLANAPADRAWRRRGYLVLCRSQANIMQQIGGIGSTPAGMARRTHSDAVRVRTAAIGCDETAEGSMVDEGTRRD